MLETTPSGPRPTPSTDAVTVTPSTSVPIRTDGVAVDLSHDPDADPVRRHTLDDDMRSAVDQRLAERLAEADRRRKRRRADRAQMAERRTAGLRIRHQRKLDRAQEEQP